MTLVSVLHETFFPEAWLVFSLGILSTIPTAHQQEAPDSAEYGHCSVHLVQGLCIHKLYFLADIEGLWEG